MEISSQQQGKVLVLSPRGRIDHSSAELFRTALEPHLAQCTATGTPLVLDFSGIEYISSVGLRVLMVAAKQSNAKGGKIVLAALQPMVLEVFKISRFDLVFKITDNVEAALAQLQ